jgi:hypothetical protein
MFAQNKIQEVQAKSETGNTDRLLSEFSLLPDLQFNVGTKSSLCYTGTKSSLCYTGTKSSLCYTGTKSSLCHTPQRRKAGLKPRFCPYAPIRTKVQKRPADLVGFRGVHEVQNISKKLSYYTPKRNSRKKRRFSPFKHT